MMVCPNCNHEREGTSRSFPGLPKGSCVNCVSAAAKNSRPKKPLDPPSPKIAALIAMFNGKSGLRPPLGQPLEAGEGQDGGVSALDVPGEPGEVLQE